jgi:hypothetical protein
VQLPTFHVDINIAMPKQWTAAPTAPSATICTAGPTVVAAVDTTVAVAACPTVVLTIDTTVAVAASLTVAVTIDTTVAAADASTAVVAVTARTAVTRTRVSRRQPELPREPRLNGDQRVRSCHRQ